MLWHALLSILKSHDFSIQMQLQKCDFCHIQKKNNTYIYAMKFFASILFLYIMVLTALPSVRAIKVTFIGKYHSESQQSSCENNDPLDCQKGKIIMMLNFSPIQYFNESLPYFSAVSNSFETIKKEKLNYKKVFIDQYHNSIWQPPKIIA